MSTSKLSTVSGPPLVLKAGQSPVHPSLALSACGSGQALSLLVLLGDFRPLVPAHAPLQQPQAELPVKQRSENWLYPCLLPPAP